MNHKTGLVTMPVCSAIILLCALHLSGCGRSGINPMKTAKSLFSGGDRGTKESGKPSSPEVRSAYLVIPLCTLGVAASFFAIFLGGGYTKIGMAGLGTSVLTAAYAMAQAKFAWLFALGGLAVGVLCLLNAWQKNRKIIHGAIDAIEDIKWQFFPRDTEAAKRDAVNRTLTGHLPREATAIVAAQKIARKQKEADEARKDTIKAAKAGIINVRMDEKSEAGLPHDPSGGQI